MIGFWIIYAIIGLAAGTAYAEKKVDDAKAGGWTLQAPHAGWQLMGTILQAAVIGGLWPLAGAVTGIRAGIARLRK